MRVKNIIPNIGSGWSRIVPDLPRTYFIDRRINENDREVRAKLVGNGLASISQKSMRKRVIDNN
jgi:hypothetical protein